MLDIIQYQIYYSNFLHFSTFHSIPTQFQSCCFIITFGKVLNDTATSSHIRLSMDAIYSSLISLSHTWKKETSSWNWGFHSTNSSSKKLMSHLLKSVTLIIPLDFYEHFPIELRIILGARYWILIYNPDYLWYRLLGSYNAHNLMTIYFLVSVIYLTLLRSYS